MVREDGGPERNQSSMLLVDAMLGSLARKLRIFGFDTVYFREGPDSELERLARAQGRVVLTSDVQLSEMLRRRDVTAILITGKTERSRLSALRRQAGEAGLRLEPGDSRCAVCNGELMSITRADALRSVPERSAMRHRLFYRCKRCGKVYWHGRHWARLRRLASEWRKKEFIPTTPPAP